MTDKISIRIDATDGASRVFGQVASGADRMSASLQNAGSRAGRALDQLDQAIARSQESSNRWPNITDGINNAFQSVSGFMIDNARIAAEAQVVHERLRASIEATGRSYDDYADRIEAAGAAAVKMSFDDEAALDAISAITQATGNASQAIDQLGLVMDIARARNIDLASAARIVIAADQERFTSLKRIGIALDENATKEEALAALQTKFSGQAAAYADTTTGNLERLSVEWENAREGLAAYSNEATTLAFVLPTLTTGLTKLYEGAKLLNGISVSGKAGLFGGIAAGVASVGYMLAHPESTGITEQMPLFENLEKNATSLEVTLGRLSDQGNGYALQVGQQTDSIVGDLIALSQRHHDLAYQIENDTRASSTQTLAWTQEIGRIEQTLGTDFVDDGQKLVDMIFDLNSILGYTGPGAELANEQLGLLNKQFEDKKLSPTQYAAQVDVLASSLGGFDYMAENGYKTADHFTGKVAELTKGMEQAGNQLTYQLGEKATLAANLLADAQQNLNDTFAKTQAGVTQTSTTLDTLFRGIVGNTDALAKQTQGVADWSAGIAVATEHFDEWGNSLGWWSVADDLLATLNQTTGQAQITQDDYNAALQANTDIQSANTRVQQDVLSIQTQLAPIVANATTALADQLDTVAGGNTDLQLFTLGMMDAATATQALQLAQAYIGDEETFGPMIESAAKLNPMLAQILEEMGLISYNPVTGEVKLLGAEEAQSDLDRLTVATENLAYTQILISVHYNKAEADKEFEDIFGHAPGDTSNPNTVRNDLVVDLFPQYEIAPEADPATALQEQMPQYPIDVTIPVNVDWDFSGGNGPAGTGSGAGSAFGGATPIVPDIPDVTITVGADTASAESQVDELSVYAAAQDPKVTLDADAANAQAQVDELNSYAMAQDPKVTVDADTTPAQTGISDLALDAAERPVKIPVQWDFGISGPQGTGSAAGSGFGSGAFDPVTIEVNADTTPAETQIDDIFSGDRTNVGIVTISADTTAADQSIGDVATSVRSIPPGTVTLDGDNTDAMNAIDAVNNAGSSMPDQSIAIGGDASGYYDAIPTTGVTLGTNYIDIVTRQVTGVFARNGGVIPGYAKGGVVAELAEAGPELVHFASGGTAIAAHRGYYGLTPGDYVDTAPVTASKLQEIGGSLFRDLHVHSNASDPKQVAIEVARELAPAFRQANRIHEASVGYRA